MRKYLLPAMAGVALAAGALFLASRSLRVGGVYVRAAYDSARVATVLGTGGAAHRLVSDLLTRDLHVRIEHVGDCASVEARYGAPRDSLGIVPPIALFDEADGRCFSYSVRYDVPLSEPVMWRGRLVDAIPLRLTLIHPDEDFRLFRKKGLLP